MRARGRRACAKAAVGLLLAIAPLLCAPTALVPISPGTAAPTASTTSAIFRRIAISIHSCSTLAYRAAAVNAQAESQGAVSAGGALSHWRRLGRPAALA